MHIFLLYTLIYKKELFIRLNEKIDLNIPNITQLCLNIGLPFSILQSKYKFLSNLICLEKMTEQKIFFTYAKKQNTFLNLKKYALTGFKVNLTNYNSYIFIDFFIFQVLFSLSEQYKITQKNFYQNNLFLNFENYINIYIIFKIFYLLDMLYPLNIMISIQKNNKNNLDLIYSLMLFSCLFFPIT